MEKLHPRAVIFDLGSTLIEYESIPWDELGEKCAAAAYRFLKKKKLDLPDQGAFDTAFVEIRDRFHVSAREALVEWDVTMIARKLLEQFNLPGDSELVDAFFDAYYRPVHDVLFVYDDTTETLRKIRDAFPVIGLVSNTVFPERAHHDELKRFGIQSFFDFTVFSSTFKLRKPHPDIFIHAANLAGHAPADCVYVGDRYMEDIEGPHGIGMNSILKVKANREYPDKMPLAERRIDTLSQLAEHLDI